MTFPARDVPAVGYRTYRARPAPLAAGPCNPTGREPAPDRDRDEAITVAADPAKGRHAGPASGWTAPSCSAARGNELVLQPEHPLHPRWGEGPWLLCPPGPAPDAARPGRGPRRALPGRPAAGSAD